MALLPSFFEGSVIKIFVSDEYTGKTVPSNVRIYNPVTGDVKRSDITRIDDNFQIVVSKTDFGELEDSVEFLDIEIDAVTLDSFQTKKIIRIDNPDFLSENYKQMDNEFDVTLEVETLNLDDLTVGNNEEDEELDRTILTGNLKAYGISESFEQEEIDKITIEEFESINMRPLLNYVFFDENKADLPERYRSTLPVPKKDFNEKVLSNKNTIQTYYYLLHVIGYRLKKYNDTVLKLIGSLDGKNEKDIELSKRRAENVKKFIVEHWEIEPSRISTESVELINKASNPKTEEGRQENRRVELYSNDPRILEPIITEDTILNVIPKTIRYEQEVFIKGGIANWQLDSYSGLNSRTRTLLKRYSGEGEVIQNIDWNVNDHAYKFNSSDTILHYEMLLTDKKSRKTIVYKGDLGIDRVALKQKRSELIGDVRKDKFSLILFDYNKADLGIENEKIISIVKKYIQDNSQVVISGFTDQIGNSTYNLKLSRLRAMQANKLLNYQNTKVQAFGESRLLYDNELPEGRFYCRTVQIEVITPLE